MRVFLGFQNTFGFRGKVSTTTVPGSFDEHDYIDIPGKTAACTISLLPDRCR